MEMESDLTDAKVVGQRYQELPTHVSIGSINIPIDSMTYDMKHPQRGKCLIFNHQIFDINTGLSPRKSTDKDAVALTKCFRSLQFDVIRYNDASYRDICEAMIKISNEDHSDRDCIVVVILTHGEEDKLWARDRKYSTDQLFAHLKGDRCLTLLGKPKIFIIQACRGELLDSGSRVQAQAVGMDVVDGRQPVYRIPSIADFLVYYSTPPGYYSFRNTEYGSYFIHTLVLVLNEYSYKYRIDLLTLFTIVNQKVAFGFESNVPKHKEYHKKKQIPCISSMLTRLIYFSPKPVQSRNLRTEHWL